MLGFLIQIVLPIIGTIALGVGGWFLTHFVAGPVLDFYKIRQSVHEEMFFTANLAPGYFPKEKLLEASASIRRLAARLDALRVSLREAPRHFLSSRGYDLAGAKDGLIGFSNSIGKTDASGRPDGSSALHRHKVQKSLKLPCDYTDQQITEIAKTIGQRS